MTELSEVGVVISAAAMVASLLAAREIHQLAKLQALWTSAADRRASDEGQITK